MLSSRVYLPDRPIAILIKLAILYQVVIAITLRF
jgi:hypothetical protein